MALKKYLIENCNHKIVAYSYSPKRSKDNILFPCYAKSKRVHEEDYDLIWDDIYSNGKYIGSTMKYYEARSLLLDKIPELIACERM